MYELAVTCGIIEVKMGAYLLGGEWERDHG
jgi:hypothetical protein